MNRRVRCLQLLLTILALFAAAATLEASGELDRSFGQNGVVLTDFGQTDQARAVALQPDGKIVVAGTSYHLEGDPMLGRFYYSFALARYNADGSLDQSFGFGGKMRADTQHFDSNGRRDGAYAVAIQHDGKILVGGEGILLRYHSNGSFDASFGVRLIRLVALDIAIQSDGKIIVAGKQGPFGGDPTVVARFNGDGGVDSSFGIDGQVVDSSGFGALEVEIQPDGRIVAAGYRNSASTSTSRVLRLLPDGSRDFSFGAAGVADHPLRGVSDFDIGLALQQDGKVVIGGAGDLLRLNVDGTLDSTFGSGGRVVQQITMYSLAVQPDGKLVAADRVFRVARFNADGSADVSFHGDGMNQICDGGRAVSRRMALQSDLGIVVVGEITLDNVGYAKDFVLKRFHGDTPSVAPLRRRVTGDFDGDGVSELIWRHSGDGLLAMWQMNGRAIASGDAVAPVNLNWQLQGYGDFNGDLKDDMVWRNRETGEVAMWEMDGRTITNGAAIAVVADRNWQIQAFGDFSGDGRSDIIWRHMASGDVAIWEMDGHTLRNGQIIAPVPDFAWHIVAAADFDGDGRSALLWRNLAERRFAMWDIDGARLIDGTLMRVYDEKINGPDQASWEIQAVGEFAGLAAGGADIIWRNARTGELLLWQMCGRGYPIASTTLPTVSDLNWQIQTSGEYLGDRRTQLIWRHTTTGEVAMWEIDDRTLTNGASFVTVPEPKWQIQPRGRIKSN